jgi:hypothetical protein
LQDAIAVDVGDGQHKAIDALTQQLFHHGTFALGAVIGGGQQQAIATQPRSALHGLKLLGEHRVKQAGHDHANQPSGLQAQLTAQQVWPKTELPGSGKYLLAGAGADYLGRGKTARGGGS